MKKFLSSFRFAWNGITIAFAEQRNLKVHSLIAVVVIGLGFYFEVTTIEWSVLIICIGLVFSLELINTAIENMVDLVAPERNPLAGKVKDIAAGAVLIAAIASAVTGVIIFYGYVFDFFTR